MACLKWLKWLFIPVFAILLMSHNTYAIELTQDVSLVTGNFQFQMAPYSWSCYNDSSCPSWTSGVYQRSFSSFGANITDISVSIPNRSYVADDWIVFDFYFFHSNTAANHSIFDGIKYAGSNPVDVVDVQFEQLTDNSSHATVYLRVWNSFTDSNLRFVGNATLFQLQSAATAQYKAEVDAGIMTVWHAKAATDYSSDFQDIVDAIENNTSPSAEDIADAVNEPEEQATENISNQSADDYEMESANMSSLFSQFGNFISAVNGASIGDCNIPADFNHIDLGVLDLCRNPVPDYVQVAVSIVLCMLIAPYLMNIIKRILSIADKIREV